MEHSIIANVIFASNDRKIFGKIRLQKIFYLLEQLGLKSGFFYSYRHYGPYSEDLSNAVFFAEFFNGSVMESEGVTRYGNTYNVFSLSKNGNQVLETCGDLSANEIERLVNILEAPSSVVIELAATIHWLREKEQVADWKAELKTRKARKANEAGQMGDDRMLAEAADEIERLQGIICRQIGAESYGRVPFRAGPHWPIGSLVRQKAAPHMTGVVKGFYTNDYTSEGYVIDIENEPGLTTLTQPRAALELIDKGGMARQSQLS